MNHLKNISSLKTGTAAIAAIAATAGLTVPAIAQDADAEYSGLGEIIVTAQKRAQNIQDVPIAITAITGDALAANRVVSVADLSSLAPGMTVSEGIGGNKLPSFSMRGAVSFGVVPGTDKQISTYIDGVYLSAGRG
ncbi:MAG: TonB-dependent receptor, plug, partial [Sphingobacteriales bacterium]